MKVILNRRSQYIITLNKDDDIPGNMTHTNISSVLADDTADKQEKADTIFYTLQGSLEIPAREMFDVFVMNDDGAMVFTGEVHVHI